VNSGLKKRNNIVVTVFLPNGFVDSYSTGAVAANAFGWPENDRDFRLQADR
jgi:hypothetical protein